MSDNAVTQDIAEAVRPASKSTINDVETAIDAKEAKDETNPSNGTSEDAKEAPITKGEELGTSDNSTDKSAQELTSTSEPQAKSDMALKEEDEKTDAPANAAGTEDGADPTPAAAFDSKSKARRKSAGVPEHKSKKLSKKASKAKMSHIDAKPGEHYYIKLKGYPLWPGVICADDMLPKSLIDSRPVTAANEHGVYREDFQEGGKRVHDRSFPVMYLYTNEFGWIPNYDLVDLDLETVGQVPENTRKDLYQAHRLAAEKHDLDFYRQVLQDFQTQQLAEIEAKKAAQAAKAATKSKGKRKSAVSTAAAADNDAEVEDIEMTDAPADLEADEQIKEKPKSSKKRKAVAEADENAAGTPQRAESAKKPKIKLNATPKSSNGTATPKPSAKKDPKPKKAKKAATNGEAVPAAPKEPELTPEEKRLKKEKEIMFLRHKLQKGLLTRDQQPKEEEMRQMSEYVNKLEGQGDLEVSIIRATKINKVLKAILKLEEIPKESEFKFKDRSQSLLEKWNKVLESAAPLATSTTAPAVTENTTSKEVINGTSQSEEGNTKTEPPVEQPTTVLDTDTPLKITPKDGGASEAATAPTGASLEVQT
ncbi:MAG: hypothetical protein M1818_001507 [Claussenomyces sp. TS43310]|nr:MAG: hypothetical protein M1818_001507 [Claussenomyces sp. TS43310]